jgi:NAD-dependent histone deacetylase SIR2
MPIVLTLPLHTVYTLAHELYPGKFRPTPTHTFIKLLETHNLLQLCFTQNIDTLERRAGVPDHKIIEAHGSFATQSCIDCQEPYDAEDMKLCIELKEIARCLSCNGLVKPDIVFFGESVGALFLSLIRSRAVGVLIRGLLIAAAEIHDIHIRDGTG